MCFFYYLRLAIFVGWRKVPRISWRCQTGTQPPWNSQQSPFQLLRPYYRLCLCSSAQTNNLSVVYFHGMCLLCTSWPRSWYRNQSTNCRRRLIRDFKRLSTDPPGGVSGSPCPDNIMLWNAVIFGPGQFIASPILICLTISWFPKKTICRRHTFWGWHIQTLTNVRWVLSQQTTLCEILVEDVPS